jgi:hypothetical protein
MIDTLFIEYLLSDFDGLLIEARIKQMSLRKKHTWGRVERAQRQIDDVLKKLKKKQTISVAKIVELNNHRKMPTMMKHAVVAIEKKLHKMTNENRAQRFIGAHNIAFWAFRRYGYINKSGFNMTGRGQVRNKMHQTEGAEGGTKTNRYAIMYNTVFRRDRSQLGYDRYIHARHPKIRGS